jgi:hypothetical protein
MEDTGIVTPQQVMAVGHKHTGHPSYYRFNDTKATNGIVDVCRRCTVKAAMPPLLSSSNWAHHSCRAAGLG